MTNQDSTRQEADAQHFAAVIVADGITVSRPNIEDWLAGQERTDLTDEVMRLLTYGNYEVPTDHDDPRSLRSMTEPQDSTTTCGFRWRETETGSTDLVWRTCTLPKDHTTPVDHHDEDHERSAHLTRARYLGADAALAAAASLTMSTSDAADFLDGDGSHDLRERYLSDGEPSLSGEWADALHHDLGVDIEAMWMDTEACAAITTAWVEGRDAVWPDAVTAFARRITGDIGGALALEASNEAYVDSLRRS